MKSWRNSAPAEFPGESGTLPGRFLTAILLVVAAFCAPALPADPAPEIKVAESKAAEWIAEQLPDKKTLKSASQTEFLSAVCAVVRRRRSSAAVITQTAVNLRRESAGEVVGMVLRCVGKANCEAAGAIVAAASAAEGDLEKIADAAMARTPDCAETIREATRHKEKASEGSESETTPEPGPLIGTSAGPDEGFDPREPLNLVCVDGVPRAVRTSQLDEFLRANPGALVGPCPPTPSPSPALAPAAP